MNYYECVSQIKKFEKTESLFDSGARIRWTYMRMYILYFVLGSSSQNTIASFGVKTKVFWFFKSIFKFNFFKFFSRCDTLYVFSQRYVGGEEIYLDRIRNNIEGESLSIGFSQYGEFQGKHVFLDIVKILFKFTSKFMAPIVKQTKLTKSIVNNFKFDGIEKYSTRLQLEFALWNFFYFLLLRLVMPKRVFLVGGVYYTPLINAAEILGVKTIEVQHGIINKLHLAYDFPNVKRDYLFSNELWLFSEKWSNISYPIGCEIKIIGNDFYYCNTSSEDLIKDETSDLLYISSDTHGSIMHQLAERISDLDKLKSKYRFHPKEVKKEFENDLIEMSVIELNVELSKCNIVISTCSTVVYQALELGCSVLVIDFGQHYFDDLKHPNLMGIVQFECFEKLLEQVRIFVFQNLSVSKNRSNVLQGANKGLFFQAFSFPPYRID